ncbi:solute carrier family 41 member 1-like [Cloeon dipterum]|uniref:solute carrier family 41 member 1-like n=1 Tax=Cloeon dipterum TaxID=197152 RepID=UPI003220394A
MLANPSTPVRRKDESDRAIVFQIFIPFVLSGFATIGTGILLDYIDQNATVFKKVNATTILVPALLGLKGNLEMTLASRLSTKANIDNMDTTEDFWSMIKANLALIEFQAIVVGFLGSLAASIINEAIESQTFHLDHVLLLCTSSLVTASIVHVALGNLVRIFYIILICVSAGAITICVINYSRKCNINPDNVAIPIATSLGDFASVVVIFLSTTLLYSAEGSLRWVASLIFVGLAFLAVFCFRYAKCNEHTQEMLKRDWWWLPMMVAIAISVMGGFVLQKTVKKFKKFAVFQTVINGSCGNLVAVQASKISTFLHKHIQPGTVDEESGNTRRIFVSLEHTLYGINIISRTCRFILAMAFPGHMIFLFFVYITRRVHMSWVFLTSYLIVAELQVCALIYIK